MTVELASDTKTIRGVSSRSRRLGVSRVFGLRRRRNFLCSSLRAPFSIELRVGAAWRTTW